MGGQDTFPSWRNRRRLSCEASLRCDHHTKPNCSSVLEAKTRRPHTCVARSHVLSRNVCGRDRAIKVINFPPFGREIFRYFFLHVSASWPRKMAISAWGRALHEHHKGTWSVITQELRNVVLEEALYSRRLFSEKIALFNWKIPRAVRHWMHFQPLEIKRLKKPCPTLIWRWQVKIMHFSSRYSTALFFLFNPFIHLLKTSSQRHNAQPTPPRWKLVQHDLHWSQLQQRFSFSLYPSTSIWNCIRTTENGSAPCCLMYLVFARRNVSSANDCIFGWGWDGWKNNLTFTSRAYFANRWVLILIKKLKSTWLRKIAEK